MQGRCVEEKTITPNGIIYAFISIPFRNLHVAVTMHFLMGMEEPKRYEVKLKGVYYCIFIKRSSLSGNLWRRPPRLFLEEQY